MRLKIQKTHLLFTAVAALMLIAHSASAQNDTTPKKRLRGSTVVKGSIGGESHDSYVIRARRGQVMTMRISWRREGDNKAEFTVSESANFFNAEQVGFGKADDKRWTGKIPRTRDYYIYVVAHPTARYTLTVTMK